MKQKINSRLLFISMVVLALATVSITFVYYGLFQEILAGRHRKNMVEIDKTQIFEVCAVGVYFLLLERFEVGRVNAE